MSIQAIEVHRMSNEFTRRNFVRTAAGAFTLATTALAQEPSPKPNAQNEVQLSQIHGPSEQDEKAPGPFLSNPQRVGYAIVGLGRLSLDQILPAFARSEYCKPVALVSGDRAKALKIANQYGIRESSIDDYANYERLADNPEVQAIYIVLPNGLHEEYIIRGAKLKKHIICEKPMSVGSDQAKRMIAACAATNTKLMIAYRQQYEPNNKLLQQMVKDRKLGKLRGFISSNSQQEGDPTQWRSNLKLAGGGCLPDVGLYCINASRFLSGEEPIEASATIWQPNDDPRFREIEASCSFTLRFPSGYIATCTSSYDVHKSQFFRLEGDQAWAELSPAYAYHGNKLKLSRLDEGREVESAPQLEEKDQFALEMDHFAQCILQNLQPHTPGEEGLRDHRVIEAIYEACRTGKTVKILP
jgi:predicted dehydrogenase